jgi:LPXTG-site transpeptidase (sortase) family protein
MLLSSIRRIAFGAVLLGLALAGPGVSSAKSSPNGLLAVRASTIAAFAVRDHSPDQDDPGRLVQVVVAPPVRLQIPSLSIDVPVEALGVDSSGAMDTPRNLWNTGWYRDGPSPGATGDAVIDGHVGLPGSPLVFSGLGRLAIGSDVIAVLADGTRNRFTVSGAQVWPANSHPPGLFAAAGQPRLSLITCTGRYDRFTQTYGDRLIVEATYVGR